MPYLLVIGPFRTGRTRPNIGNEKKKGVTYENWAPCGEEKEAIREEIRREELQQSAARCGGGAGASSDSYHPSLKEAHTPCFPNFVEKIYCVGKGI